MKTTRKSDSQIMQILSQAGSGVPVSELCREHAQSLATQWMWVYNNERPHSSIGGVPPRKLLEAI